MTGLGDAGEGVGADLDGVAGASEKPGDMVIGVELG